MPLGKEIYLFFGRFGTNGIYGILVACILFGIIIYKVIFLSHNNNISSYSEFLDFLFPKNLKKIKVNFLLNVIINLFLLASFFIMVSAFGAFFKQELNVPSLLRKCNYLYFMLYYF